MSTRSHSSSISNEEEREFHVDSDGASTSSATQPRSGRSDASSTGDGNGAGGETGGDDTGETAPGDTTSHRSRSRSNTSSRASFSARNEKDEKEDTDKDADKNERDVDGDTALPSSSKKGAATVVTPRETRSHQEEEEGSKPVSPRSPGARSTGATSTVNNNSSTSRARGKKSLDTIDLNTITEEDLAKQVKKSGIRRPQGAVAKLFTSLPKIAFALFDSPRTLQALAEEGIDPSESLLHRNLKDFMRVSKGDATCAKIRYQHYETKRSEVLETLKQRRQRIIQQQEEQSTQRAVRTPVVQPTEELTGVVPPPRSESQQAASSKRKSDDTTTTTTTSAKDSKSQPASPLTPADACGQQGTHSDGDDFYSGEDSEEESARRKRGSKTSSVIHEVLSPDEFARREAERKKAKVLRQAAKMREVMQANARREQQKEETMAKILAQREQREAELAKKKRRHEIDRRVKESKAAKKEAELQVLREKREQAMQAKIIELHNERGRKLQEFEDREQQRREQEEAEQEQLNIQRTKKRHRVAIRALAIHDHSEKVANDQKESLLQRMSKADQVREEMNEKKEKELTERKRMIAEQTIETKKKREAAAEEYVSKINRYKDKAAAAEAQRKIAEKEREDYFLFRSLQEKEKERERQEITEKVRLDEQRRAEELLAQLEAAELHCKEVHQTKEAENRVKAAKNALILDDRKDKVKRMQRMVQHSIDEAEQAYDAKMSRIESLMKDAKEADEYRKQIQFKSAKMAQSMAEANKKRALLSAAPGPLDYAAVDAEKYLHGPGPGVNMGTPGHKSKKLDFTPGPGAYGRPDGPRKIRGGILPPKDVVGIADVQQILSDRKKKAEKEKRERVKESQLEKQRREKEGGGGGGAGDRRASSTLPAIGKNGGSSGLSKTHQPRSDSAPLVATNKSRKSVRIVDHDDADGSSGNKPKVGNPSELKEEDFCSSDEYDSGSDDEREAVRNH